MIVTYYYPWDYFYPVRSGAASVAAAHLDYFKSRGHRPRIMINGGRNPAARRAFERYYHWVEDICVLHLHDYPAIQRLREIYSFGSTLMWHKAICQLGVARDFLAKPADLAFINYIFATPLLDAVPVGAKRILESIDIMSHQFAASQRSPISMQHSLRAEFDLYGLYDLVLMLNRKETELATSRGAANAVYVPRSVAVINDEADFETPAPNFDLLFVGSEHLPNAEGVCRFYETVFLPFLKPRGLRWAIAGSVCKYLSIRDPAVKILGLVGDLAALYRDSRVAIVPIFSGAGVSIKTLEALGAGKPVVTTPTGTRGLPDCEHALVRLAFDAAPETVADRILGLVRSGEMRRQYARAGIRYIRSHFSPDTYRCVMDDALNRLSDAPTASPGRAAYVAHSNVENRERLRAVEFAA